MIWRFQNQQWHKVALHNEAKGLTAIIVCNGPSLKSVDTARLGGAGRVVIGVNSSYPAVRPDFWIGMDKPENYHSGLWSEPFMKIMRGGNHNIDAVKRLGESPGVRFMGFREDERPEAIFDAMNGSDPVWHKDTFRAAIHFALYLGCTSLVFVGVDLDNSNQHYADGSYLTGAQRDYNARLYNAQFDWLKWFAGEAEKHGVSCHSLSKASKINEFIAFVGMDTFESPVGKRGILHCKAPVDECNEYIAHQKRGGKPYSAGHQAMYLTAVELLRGTKSSILEIGFGIGYGLGELIKADCVGGYWGCEPCRDSYDYTSGKFSDTQADVSLALGGWRDHDMPESDYAFCIEVFEHLPHDDRAEFLRLVRHKTRKALFLSTPDSDDHLHGVVNREGMESLLKEAGWQVVAIKAQWTVLFVATP